MIRPMTFSNIDAEQFGCGGSGTIELIVQSDAPTVDCRREALHFERLFDKAFHYLTLRLAAALRFRIDRCLDVGRHLCA